VIGSPPAWVKMCSAMISALVSRVERALLDDTRISVAP
jgi:hypothetical protein